MGLKVKTEQRSPGVEIISPIGSIRHNTYLILENAVDEVLEKKPDVIIFDLEFLDYINSLGIRVLLRTKKALKETGGKMVFMNLQPQIKKVFAILEALPSLKVFASIQELDQYLDTMQRAARMQKIRNYDQ
jgi:anti-sigma B factor antagonist